MTKDLNIDLVNFHRYERYEGKNLSDALGSLLKRKMRSGALQNRIFGSKQEYMMRMLEEIDDDTNLEDLVFDSRNEAFTWLQMCMQKTDQDDFSKKFKRIEMIWVTKEEIPVNLVQEKAVRKIPNVKSFNMGTSIAGTSGVLMRDNSCTCDECQSGNVLRCKSEKNGTYKKFIVQKNEATATASDESEEESADEEFDYDSAIDDLSSGLRF